MLLISLLQCQVFSKAVYSEEISSEILSEKSLFVVYNMVIIFLSFFNVFSYLAFLRLIIWGSGQLVRALNC